MLFRTEISDYNTSWSFNVDFTIPRPRAPYKDAQLEKILLDQVTRDMMVFYCMRKLDLEVSIRAAGEELVIPCALVSSQRCQGRLIADIEFSSMIPTEAMMPVVGEPVAHGVDSDSIFGVDGENAPQFQNAGVQFPPRNFRGGHGWGVRALHG
jgi:hypothetical protein